MNLISELAGAAQGKHSGKWTPVIHTYKVVSETDRYCCGTLEGGYGWDTEQLALAAGRRAVDVVNVHGKFPNMCEPY